MPHAQLSLKSYLPSTDTHHHDYHQLVLPVAGCLDIEIGHSVGTVNQQQGAVICASEDHAFEAHGYNQFIVADIPNALAPSFSKLPIFIQLDDNINRYLHFLQAQLTATSDTKNQLMQRQMLLLLIQLIDEKNNSTSLFDKRVDAGRQYLADNYAQAKALDNAGQHACLSPRHFRQLFQQYYEMTPSQYLLELRMQAAWQLLHNSQHSIQHIALHCGYSNASSFSHRFQQHFKHSPMHIRRLNT